MLDLIQNEQPDVNESLGITNCKQRRKFHGLTGFTDKRKPKEERKYVCHGDEENR